MVGAEGDAAPEVAIAGRPVGAGHRPYVIAELSANHGGSLERAEAVVRAAAAAGADAVKLQTYTADSMTLDLDEGPFVVGPGSPWEGRRLHDLYEEAHTPWAWHEPLFALAAELGLHCFSTPFDLAAVERLEELDPPAYKIASFELLDLRLIARAASTGKPVIMSTGMATVDEIDEAVDAARSAGAGGVVLLRCNSAYPAPPAEMDLAAIPEMIRRWRVPVGFSDHTIGSTAAIAATALGAAAVEKHLIGDRAEGGPDSSFSAIPDELARVVDDVRVAAAARGRVRFGPSPSEEPSLAFRRSLYVVADLGAGDIVTEQHVRAIRPGGGLAPKHLAQVIGRRAARPLRRGTPLRWDDLQADLLVTEQ